MAFRGSIAPGSEVEIHFWHGAGAEVAARLVIGFGLPGFPESGPAIEIAAGSSGHATIRARAGRVLSIHVHLSGRRTIGTLEIRIDGAVETFQTIADDSWWFYTVKKEAEAHALHRLDSAGE